MLFTFDYGDVVVAEDCCDRLGDVLVGGDDLNLDKATTSSPPASAATSSPPASAAAARSSSTSSQRSSSPGANTTRPETALAGQYTPTTRIDQRASRVSSRDGDGSVESLDNIVASDSNSSSSEWPRVLTLRKSPRHAISIDVHVCLSLIHHHCLLSLIIAQAVVVAHPSTWLQPMMTQAKAAVSSRSC